MRRRAVRGVEAKDIDDLLGAISKFGREAPASPMLTLRSLSSGPHVAREGLLAHYGSTARHAIEPDDTLPDFEIVERRGGFATAGLSLWANERNGSRSRVELFANSPTPGVLERVGRFIQREYGYCVGAFDSLSLDGEGFLFVPEAETFPPDDQRMLDVWFTASDDPHRDDENFDITFLRLVPLLPDELEFALKAGRPGGAKLWKKIQSPSWERFFGLF